MFPHDWLKGELVNLMAPLAIPFGRLVRRANKLSGCSMLAKMLRQSWCVAAYIGAAITWYRSFVSLFPPSRTPQRTTVVFLKTWQSSASPACRSLLREH